MLYAVWSFYLKLADSMLTACRRRGQKAVGYKIAICFLFLFCIVFYLLNNSHYSYYFTHVYASYTLILPDKTVLNIDNSSENNKLDTQDDFSIDAAEYNVIDEDVVDKNVAD